MAISPTFAERLLFHPEHLGSTSPPVVAGTRARDIWLTAEDGTRIHSWLFEVPGEAPIVILFHGNAGHIGHRTPLAAGLVSRQLSVLLVDYRGYGRSEGRPSEKGLYLDGEATYGFVVDRLGGARKVVLFGRSLGAAVATHVASRREVGCLVLEAPFTSLGEIAAAVYPFLPSFLFRRLRGRLDTLTEISRVSSPVLVIHGTRDRIVPFRMGEAIYRAAPEPRTWFPVEGAGHNDVYYVGGDDYFDRIACFIQQALAQGSKPPAS